MSTEHKRGLNQQEKNISIDPSMFRESNPWRVVVDLNEACNIQCTYCHIDALYGIKARDSRTLHPIVFKELLQDSDQMQVLDITLTGGEITIMTNLSEYLKNITNLSFSSVQMITNGTRLTKALSKELKESGVQRVSISIDGPESSNDQARGTGVWQKAWKGLENSVAAELPVNVISVLGKHNIEDWYKLPKMLKEAGATSQNVSLMCRLGRAETSEEWLGIPEDRLDDVYDKVLELQHNLNDDEFSIFFNDGVMRSPGWSGKPTPLHAFQDQNPGIEAVVKVDGTILRNRLYGKNRAIGNLITVSLFDLWNLDKSRRKQLTGVVGNENVGNLPKLYYHYSETIRDKMHSDVEDPNMPISQRLNKIRVREESWGTIVFDPRTFTIIDIIFREKADE